MPLLRRKAPRGSFEIVIQNRQTRTRISLAKLRRLTCAILRKLGWKWIGLSLVVVSDAQIRKLHYQFLKKNEPTDVLAFGKEEGLFLGDVVISIDAAKRQAPRFGKRWDEELLLYVCHGILHLMGWQDSTAAQKKRMDRKQEAVLKKVLGRKWLSKKQKLLF